MVYVYVFQSLDLVVGDSQNLIVIEEDKEGRMMILAAAAGISVVAPAAVVLVSLFFVVTGAVVVGEDSRTLYDSILELKRKMEKRNIEKRSR